MSQSNQDNTSNMDVIHTKEELHTATSDYDHDVKSSPRDYHNADDENDETWVLQIKMVGHETNQSDFSISLHPNDDIIQLYQEISNITDIPYHQQRLIYRGRLLPHIHHTSTASTTSSSMQVNSNAPDDVSSLQPHTVGNDITLRPNDSITKRVASTGENSTSVSQQLRLNQKVCDIVGLMNGHAIHLVVRHNSDNPAATEDDDENEEELTTTFTSDPASTTSSSSPSGSTSLLAALLGMGNGTSSSSNDNSSNNNARTTRPTTSSSSSHPRRQHTYRLTDEDWVRPDPGSLETVRQGLMTYHTLHQINGAATNTAVTSNIENDASMALQQQQQQPNRCGRHFYLGQWIDCRDTVNQWLEATVVSILYPRDIMHSYHNASTTSTECTSSDTMNNNNNNASFSFQPTTDPPIAVTDFDGRRRLLLESCTESESEENIDGEHYRRRTNNDNVQILHIHYNGWPVRWDEWIRSDSERIRVFRTRTRHHPSLGDPQSQRHYVSPNIDAVMPDAPYTYMTNSEQSDRSVLLSELHRALQTLEHRVATVSSSAMTTATTNTNTVRTSRQNHLPWMTGETHTATSTSLLDANYDDLEEHEPIHHSQPEWSRQQQRQELEALAPLLDRLGRVLIDAAPHVLALADTIGHEDEDEDDDDADDNNESQVEYDTDETEQQDSPPATNTLGGLLSLLNRDRRGGGRGSVASGSNVALPSVVSDVEISTVASSSTTTTDMVVHPTEPINRTNVTTSNTIDPDNEDFDEGQNEATMEYIDPDYRDYAAGLVNTSRGDIRSTGGSGSSSSRRGSSSDDGTTSLLGAYLAAMSLGGIASISTGDREDGNGGVAEGLGRLFRDRGAGSGGIDIHIHAVVTAPGIDGAIGFAALTGGEGAGGGAPFPVATPVTGQDTTTNVTHGGLGSLFGGPASQRRGVSRRFRSTTAATTISDTTMEEQPMTGETNVVEDDLDLFADLYSETPDPINPNNPSYLVAAASVVTEPDDDNVEYHENSTLSSSPLRQYRSRSLRRIHTIHNSSSGDNAGEQFQHPTPRSHRNINHSEQRNSGNANSNLLRRIFRRPDGGH